MLQSLSEYGWFDENDDSGTIKMKLQQIISEINSHEELIHAMIAKTWCFDEEDLWLILDHPLCDYGIALRSYWMCQPYWFYRQIERNYEFSEPEKKKFEGIKLLEKRLLNNHYKTKEIYCCPEELYGKPIKDDDLYNPGMKFIPTELRKTSQGQVIEPTYENIFR